MTSKQTKNVGETWELSVDGKDPVTFSVSGPTGTRQVRSNPSEDGKKQVAAFVLDAPGDFSAVVDGVDDSPNFSASAK